MELAVVGIGADGWPGLAPWSRDVLTAADVVVGGARQLDLLPPEVRGERTAWPSPLVPALPDLLGTDDGRKRAVLASGDPTFFGVAGTIARVLPGLPLRILPHVSSVSLACARLGWAAQDAAVVSLVGRAAELLHPEVQPGRRVLLLVGDPEDPARVAALLRRRGYGPTRMVALTRLGAADEHSAETTAADWPGEGGPGGRAVDPLTVLALECLPEPGAPRRPRTPGLPDDAYEHDGQLTKRHVRAITVAMLGPAPGELLWDVGGGSGSIAIEWMRTHRDCRAISVERDPVRAARIAVNARALGVPGLQVVTGDAPAALAGLPRPDAVFVGGGTTAPGLLEACWSALPPGGRIVVNVATLESEAEINAARARWGGELTRIEVSRAAPIGRFTGWRAAMPVTQWTAIR